MTTVHLRKNDGELCVICGKIFDKEKCQFLRRKFRTTFIGIETETLLKNIPHLVLHANAFQDFIFV
jgi:hypothetical protein